MTLVVFVSWFIGHWWHFVRSWTRTEYVLTVIHEKHNESAGSGFLPEFHRKIPPEPSRHAGCLRPAGQRPRGKLKKQRGRPIFFDEPQTTELR